MSKTVDNRVVELEFDNASFESGVSKSIDSLGRLNKSLDHASSTKPFENLNSSIKGVEMNGLIGAVETVSDRFSTLGIIGMTALQNITNKAIDAGTALIKSLSVDQLTAGWSKYADKTTAVATIINNARKELTGEAYSIEEISAELDKLNWFTDETSYNFVDMVSNIGKFTSQRVGLETANIAMQGIANWAAVSGQNAAAASRAMYNMSQALGTGAVKVRDWMSIENANMATQEFKETAIQTAIELGTLTAGTDGLAQSAKKNAVSFETFRETLQDGWLTSEVLVATLQKYGSFGNRLAEVTEETGILTSTFLRGITEFQNGAESEGFVKWCKDTKVSMEEMIPYMEELTSAEYALGLKSFKAAQEARTFRDAIDAIKDGVSTSWMNVFETIFGNYEEAKKLWTGLAELGYNLFAEPINKLNEWLTVFSNHMGIDAIINSFITLKDVLAYLLVPAKEAFYEVFPKGFSISGTQAAVFLRKIERSLSDIGFFDETLDKIKNAFLGLFKVLKAGINTLSYTKKLLSPLLSLAKSLCSIFLNLASAVGSWLSSLLDADSHVDIFETAINGLANAIKWLTNLVNNFSLTEAVSGILDKISTAFANFVPSIENILASIKGLNLNGAITTLIGYGIGFGLAKSFHIIDNVIDKLTDSIKGPIASLLDSLGNTLNAFTAQVNAESLKKIGVALLLVAGAMFLLSQIDADKLDEVLAMVFASMVILGAALGALILVQKYIKGLNVRSIGSMATSLVKIAAALLIAALAMKIFSTIKAEDIGKSLILFAASLAILIAGLWALSKIKGPILIGAIALGILAGAMLILAAALAAFALVARMDAILDGFSWMAATLAVACAGLWALSKLSPTVIIAAAALLILSVALVVLAGALAAFTALSQMDGIDEGLRIMAEGLTMMAIAIGALSTASLNGIAAAAAILIMSVALIALAGAFLLMQAVNPESITNTLTAFGVILVIVVAGLAGLAAIGPMVLVAAAAILIVSVALLAGAAAFLVAAIAINTLTPALERMNAIGFGTIALGLIEFAGAMFVFSIVGAIAGIASPLLMMFAVALMLLAPAIGAFVGPLGKLQGMDLVGTADGLALLAFSLAGFDAALAILTPLSPVLAAVTVAFQKLGSAALDVGNGADLFANAVDRISTSGANFISVAPGIGKAGSQMLSSMKEDLPEAAIFVDMLNQVIQIITEYESKFHEIGSTLVSKLATGMGSKAGSTSAAMRQTMSSAANAINGYYSQFYSSGAYAAQGAVNGLASKWQEMYNTGASLARAANQGYRDNLDINSPSRVMMQNGVYTAMGAILGIESQEHEMYNAGAGLGDAATSGMKYAMERAVELLSDVSEYEPTITPVLDLSEIQNGASRLNSIIGSKTLNVGSVAARVSGISTSMAGTSTTSDSAPVSNNSVVNNYTQNNYSPKSLSRIEIYRQTKNLLVSTKG